MRDQPGLQLTRRRLSASNSTLWSIKRQRVTLFGTSDHYSILGRGFIIVPQFPKDDHRASIARSPYGSAGVYDVTFVLAVPGQNVFYKDLNFDAIMQSGDSLLFIGVGRELHGAPIGSEGRGNIVFSANAHGRLATARIRIQAKNFVEAERTAFDIISRELSYWSFISTM
jgi:hypothetical protein